MGPEESLSRYIEIGAIEIAGIEEDGQFIFNLTPAAEYLAPELWEAHEDHIDKMMMDLFEKGLLSISYDEDLNAYIELTEQGKVVAKEYGIVEIEEDK
jgi:membrane protease subunit (stomatin/prohibitin family)